MSSDRVIAAFDRYTESFRQGKGDPTPYLEQFEGEELRELELLVDSFLETGPQPDPASGSGRDPELERIANLVMTRVGGAGGGLAAMVRGLRDESDLSQTEVVRQLAGSLEADAAEAEKIDGYFHDLEWGSLPAGGISDRVLDSLAGILHTTREKLREAGQALGPSRSAAAAPFFARMADDSELGFEVSSFSVEESPGFRAGSKGMDSPAGGGRGRRSDPPDRIDELFTGGE